MRINVSKVIRNPRFSQQFSVYRKSGEWISGRFVQTETEIKMTGVVTAPNPNEIMQIPEADRVSGTMCFHSAQELFETRSNDDEKGTSDEIVWQDNRYKVSRVIPWVDYGYWKAFGVRMEGC